MKRITVSNITKIDIDLIKIGDIVIARYPWKWEDYSGPFVCTVVGCWAHGFNLFSGVTEPLKFEKEYYLVRNINIEDDERDVLIVN